MSTAPKKSEEQIHYESLASYLKYIVSIAGTLIVAIASVAIYFSYSDRNSMREEYEQTLTNVTTQIKDIKADAKETEASIKDESRYDVQLTKQQSTSELSRIQTETHQLALDETEKQVSDIFKSDKIQQIIEKNAIGELKEKLPNTIADYVTRLPKILEAANWMRGGQQEGVDILKTYFNSQSEFESEMSKKMYEDILTDLNKFYDSYAPEQIISQLKNIQIKVSYLHPIVNDKFPADQSDAQSLTLLMSYLNSPTFVNNQSLYGKLVVIKALSIISGKNFHLYEDDEINKWFNELKK